MSEAETELHNGRAAAEQQTQQARFAARMRQLEVAAQQAAEAFRKIRAEIEESNT